MSCQYVSTGGGKHRTVRHELVFPDLVPTHTVDIACGADGERDRERRGRARDTQKLHTQLDVGVPEPLTDDPLAP